MIIEIGRKASPALVSADINRTHTASAASSLLKSNLQRKALMAARG